MPTPMPTGARATGAVVFLVVGWLLANVYVANMPYEKSVGSFRELTALIGLLVGWLFMGSSVGKTYLDAAGSGLKTVFVLSFWAILMFSIWEMLKISTKKMVYDGPMDAVVDVFAIMLDRFWPLLSVGCVSVFFIGGAIGGVITEAASRRWS